MRGEPPRNHVVPSGLQPALAQFAMDHASIGVYWVGPDARIYYANSQACTMLGYSREELLGMSIPDIDPDYSAERWPVHWEELKRDVSQSFETRHRRKDGAIIPVAVVANYVHLEGYEYNVGFARDISAQKYAERVLRDSEEFFRMISENVADLISVLDLKGRCLYNNHAFIELFGDSPPKATAPFRVVHPQDRERIRQLFRRTVQTGVVHRADFRFVMPDGALRHMESSGCLIRGALGEPQRVVVISHDITERKLAEEAIQEMAFQDALTHLPNRRLLQDRLEQMMAMSQRTHLYNALMFLDLDNFKPLNDELGHDAGDALLVEVAHRLKNCVREMDTVARFGGDEFMVLLDDLDADTDVAAREAAAVAEKIRAALAAPYRIDVHPEGLPAAPVEHHCTTSIGVTMFANHDTRAEEIIRWADDAMYQAKAAGGNRVKFHESRA